MRKIRLKYPIQEIGGTVYEVSLQRSHEQEDDDQIVTKPHRPSHGNASEAQKAQRQKFKEARLYTQAAMADPELLAFYEKRAAKEGGFPYRVALSDYLNGNDLLSE